jgi:hypothetical protein
LVAGSVAALAKDWKIEEVCYDNWAAPELVQTLQDDDLVKVKPVPQTVQYLSEPMKAFQALILRRHVWHDHNPLMAIMVANVAMVIMPGQRKMVAAMQAGQEPDPKYGRWGKQRSVHNTYLTLPVLFLMISPHYPMTWSHPWNWVVLLAIALAGALVRQYFVSRQFGRNPILLPVAATDRPAGAA